MVTNASVGPCCQSASVIGANSVWLTGVLADSVAVGSGNAPVGAGTKVGGGVMVGRTGLGLTVSYNIVTAHGGTLELVPASGPGACFRVFLPFGGIS